MCYHRATMSPTYLMVEYFIIFTLQYFILTSTTASKPCKKLCLIIQGIKGSLGKVLLTGCLALKLVQNTYSLVHSTCLTWVNDLTANREMPIDLESFKAFQISCGINPKDGSLCCLMSCKSNLTFYILFNSHDHIGTDPLYCHFCESNPHRDGSL